VRRVLCIGCCCLGLLGTMFSPQRVCEHPVVRYLSDATYTIYLFHLPFVQLAFLSLGLVQYTEGGHGNPTVLWHGVASHSRTTWQTCQMWLAGLSCALWVGLVGTACLGEEWAMLLLGLRLPFDACGFRAAKAKRDALSQQASQS
jgi:hypothetical protein